MKWPGKIPAILLPSRHCEEPTGRANARPMTGSATKQSIRQRARYGLLRRAAPRNDVVTLLDPHSSRPARRRQAHHLEIAGANFHPLDQTFFDQEPMRVGKAIARQVHEQMMLGVVVHPIGRDQKPFDWTRERGAGMAERVFAGGGAGMFGDVADARYQRQPCRETRHPDTPITDARASRT